MAVWSSLASKTIGKLNIARKLIAPLVNGGKGKGVNYVPVRNCHERTLPLKPSSFVAFKFKDLVYFYLTIGALPLLAIILYNNIFIGPATLALIPEGYEPKHWEYHRHPITRFIAQHITPSKQETYERTLHNIFETREKEMILKLERKIKRLISERNDYQSWYFVDPAAKYARRMAEESKGVIENQGFPGGWIK